MKRCFPSVELKAIRLVGRTRPLNEYFGLGSGGGSGAPGCTRGSGKWHEILLLVSFWFMHSSALCEWAMLAALEYDNVLNCVLLYGLRAWIEPHLNECCPLLLQVCKDESCRHDVTDGRKSSADTVVSNAALVRLWQPPLCRHNNRTAPLILLQWCKC